MKTYTEEFDKIKKKLLEKEPFAYSRFSDGEMFILKNELLVLKEDMYITGDKKGTGTYPKEEQKNYVPEEHSYISEKLHKCLTTRKKNYFKGLSTNEDEDLSGENILEYQLKLYGEGDDEHLTFATIFLNNNYPRFLKEIMPLFRHRKLVFVVNEAANFKDLEFFNIIKDFRIGSNCIVNDYDLPQKINKWISDNNIEDAIFLISASTLSNFIIHDCFLEHDKNTYIDIGSSLSPWLGLQGWMYTRAYLQHHILRMPNKYGTQVDTWI